MKKVPTHAHTVGLKKMAFEILNVMWMLFRRREFLQSTVLTTSPVRKMKKIMVVI